MQLLINFWDLFVLSAPWLMLGLLIAGLINVYLPENFLHRHLGKEGFATTVKAALIGAPMPLCSCGVIPAAVGLRRAGASKSATTSFLVSTPETGVDSVSVSYVLLGPFMAIIRPVAAIVSAIVAGLLVVVTDKEDDKNDMPVQSKASASCCHTEAKPEPSKSCCASQSKKAETAASKIKRALHFSATKLLQDTALWLVIGLFFAALVQTFVPNSFLSQWGSGLLAMTVMVLVSIPMYICATASTPIAAGLLMAGVSPGAVLVFMLAGPATNIATLGVVGKELGRRAVAAYLLAVVGVAMLFGWLCDYLVERFGFAVQGASGAHHEVLPAWLSQASAVLLTVLLIRLVYLHFSSKFGAQATGKSC